MLVLPLVAGILTLLAVVVGVAVVRDLPVRWACPGCHHATSPIRRALLVPVSRLIQWRWCPRCHWSGLSRRRAPVVEAAEKEPSAPLVPATRFEWGEGNGGPRRRPWVFRWKNDPEERETPVETEPAHLSGFTWADQQRDRRKRALEAGAEERRAEKPPAVKDAAPRQADQPPGFQWRDPSEPRGFSWKAPEDPGPGPGELLVALLKRAADSASHPSGFRWGAGVEDAGFGDSDLSWTRSDESDAFGFRWGE